MKKPRLTKDEYYLSIARVVASRSSCLKHKYGAVIVSQYDTIVSTGYNGAPRGEESCYDTGVCFAKQSCIPRDEESAKHGSQYGSCISVHAEANALIQATYTSLQGATMYLVCLTPEREAIPCNYCNRLIANAGITKLKTGGLN